MNVAYTGPFEDYSGYGEANRHAVAALDAGGIHVIGQLTHYTSENADFGSIGQTVRRLLQNKGEYQIKILHVTPDEYMRFMEAGKYHIGHFFWETDKVPKKFVVNLNKMNEVWTGSEANKRAMEKGGVTVPIYIYPQAIETEREWPEGYAIEDFKGYLFYSIFEWTDRKNPQALIDAFIHEFKESDNVGLLIKTYFRSFTDINKRMILGQIRMIKGRAMMESYPRMWIYTELMDRQQIMRLHKTGNCFISTHSGEGWGIPQVEAMLAGNPVISTNYGGCHEYLSDMENAILLPYKMEQLKGMSHSPHLYTPDQNWARVDEKEVRKAMRFAYDNQAIAKEIGTRGNKFVKDNFNLKVVGLKMAERLKEINKELVA